MSIAPARRAALEALARVRRDEAYSGPVLAAVLARATLSPGDVAFATHLTYGVLSAQGVLDETLARYVRGSLEPRVRDALRLAAFEMLYSRTPVYATVNQAVEMVRAARPQAAGMANAVMRRLADEAAGFPWGDIDTDRGALARVSAHPRWIVDVAFDGLGEQAAREMLAGGLEPSPTFIRVDPFAPDREAVLAALSPARPVATEPDPDCYRLDVASAAFGTDAPVSGWFAMDAAAQMAPAACAPLPGQRVLDVGAGRGNKTICLQGLALRAGGAARITALDVHHGKTDALRRRLDDSGVPAVDVVAAEGTELQSRFGSDAFDVVLVDAPCSGLGTLRRYPEKRWRLTPDTPERLGPLQSQLLAAAARVVKRGGRVVYSTCSVARQENGEIVNAFLASADGRAFGIEPLGGIIPAAWSRFGTTEGTFQSWPTSGGPDGHYVAVLRRAND